MLGTEHIKVNDILFVHHTADTKTGEQAYTTDYVFHHQLIYKLSGDAIVTYRGKAVREKADDIRFLPSPSGFGENPEYKADVLELSESINIAFTSDSVLPQEMLLKNVSDSPVVKLLFQKIHKYWYHKRDGYYHRCLSVLYDIFYELSKTDSHYVSSRTYQLISPAIEYIEMHFTEPQIDYRELASLCGISYTYMAKIFIRCFGMSPNRYVTAKKIQFACDLLNSRCYSVGDIAEKCGFVNAYYFSRIFKKYAGVSPSEFIKNGVVSPLL